ncbi:MAG: hypothetical protein HZA50_02330 [Planctomycetes bacterium]|nr:hypothetical protein [Planctomycetota bacterium]
MTTREKNLSLVAAGMAVLAVLFLLVKSLLLDPAERLDTAAAAFVKKINDTAAENRLKDHYAAKLKKLAERTFGDDPKRIDAEVSANLLSMLEGSELNKQRFSLQPLTGTPKKGVYSELGWTVRASGKLDKVVKFLYLLASDRHLHQLEALSLTPLRSGGDVDLSLRYMTLVMDKPGGLTWPATRPAATMPASQPATQDSKTYDIIVARDIFRPYVPRKVDPAPVAAPPQVAPPTTIQPRPTDPPLESRLKIVGLPQWGNQSEILVHDTFTGELKKLKVGDKFGGGRIVMVDYRLMPMPQRPQILSGSRIILLLNKNYWAVELGQFLADKRQLEQGQLPLQLQGSPASMPVEGQRTANNNAMPVEKS